MLKNRYDLKIIEYQVKLMVNLINIIFAGRIRVFI